MFWVGSVQCLFLGRWDLFYCKNALQDWSGVSEQSNIYSEISIEICIPKYQYQYQYQLQAVPVNAGRKATDPAHDVHEVWDAKVEDT